MQTIPEHLKDSFITSIHEVRHAMPVMRAERMKKVLSVSDQVTDFDDGFQLLYEHIPDLVELDIFKDTMWEQPDKLVPALVGGTLKSGGQSAIMEIMSELRMLAIFEGRLKSVSLSKKQAGRYMHSVLVANLDLMFPNASEEMRNLDEATSQKITRLFNFLRNFITIEDIRTDLAREVDEICLQRPVITDRALYILRTIKKEIPLSESKTADKKLIRYVKAAFSPTDNCSGRSPVEYGKFLETAPQDVLTSEATRTGIGLRDTGLASAYHALLIRRISDKPDLLKKALGLDRSGRAELDAHAPFVEKLITELIHPETARSCYGLAGLLNRALLSHQPVKSGLERLMSVSLHPEIEEKLHKSRPDAGLDPVRILAAECLGILGRPLGIGQGWNPTCQSARGISLWSRHAPGKLLRMIETAAKTNNLTMRFEGELLSSSELPVGLTKQFDYNLDAVSVVLVPHLDRIYNRMMELAAFRTDDPHKWVNPAMYGHWIPVGFASAYDYATQSIRSYDRFMRTFYVTHHLVYNGGHDLAYPNPVGIFLTGANGKLLGFHAVSLLRVAEYEREMRIYFLNPNNEGRQQWQSDIRPSVSEHGECPGESSLPFYQFASRLYAFHYNPSDLSDLSDVDNDEIAKVRAIAEQSWGTSYTWTEDPALTKLI